MREDIAFESEGVTCRGWLYAPDVRTSARRVPAIVMAHGFSGVKEMRLDRVTLRSWERILEYSPLRWIDRVAPTPLMMIAAEHDVICPVELAREAFARAGEPKRLVVLPVGHFDPYEAPCFADAAAVAMEWFTTHLSR